MALMFEVLSRTYGWTPNQIRSMSLIDIQNYFDIINTRRLLEEAEYKKINKKRHGRK